MSEGITSFTPQTERTGIMLVERQDGYCRTCGGQLNICDADDATMTVECQECGDEYDVEPDAFGDGCVTYYIPFVVEQSAAEDRD